MSNSDFDSMPPRASTRPTCFPLSSLVSFPIRHTRFWGAPLFPLCHTSPSLYAQRHWSFIWCQGRTKQPTAVESHPSADNVTPSPSLLHPQTHPPPPPFPSRPTTSSHMATPAPGNPTVISLTSEPQERKGQLWTGRSKPSTKSGTRGVSLAVKAANKTISSVTNWQSRNLKIRTCLDDLGCTPYDSDRLQKFY